MLTLCSLILLGMQAVAVPQATPSPASGGPTGSGGGGATGGGKPPGAGGNPSETGTGSGIPNVANATNAICVPWYGIRDAIMGGLFQGRRIF